MFILKRYIPTPDMPEKRKRTAVILAAYALFSVENFLTGRHILINQKGADL
jgi:hypothetical protein